MPPSLPEVWGGIECTVNRVNDRFFDQLVSSGHAHRIDDLDRFAELGIRTIRYPVHWERVAPDSLDTPNWRWTDERLTRLKQLNIDPIVGLLHHGSGPRYTDLLDPEFPQKLARYAAMVARRYPWVTRYTPVNEPLTTARFSGLYGFWYPHRTDDESFLKILYNEVLGTILAMQAIREVQPNAQLVHTEDLGFVESTPHMGYQAAFENQRRWLGIDLLEGRVTSTHTLYNWVVRRGLSPEALQRLAANSCPADILGFNHYLTSGRFLDERTERYPDCAVGGNGHDEYVDVESLRVAEANPRSRADLLRQAWERYGRPIAITESHVYCTREEQMRWLMEGWNDLRILREEGVDARALTVWSLLGTYDWVNLCTREDGIYEPGVYDLRSSPPRPTALVSMIRELATKGEYQHPVFSTESWWRRPLRLKFPPPSIIHSVRLRPGDRRARRPVLITGGRGTLAQAFARACELRGLPYCLLTRQDLDASDSAAVAKAFDQWKPWAVINAAGYVRVDDAETQQADCFRDNVTAPVHLSKACAERGIRYVTFSSDLVFDGRQQTPYRESDPVAPLNVYGRTKAQAEQEVLSHDPKALVIRTSAFFGPWDEFNFVTQTLETLEGNRPVHAASDAIVSPTYVPDLVHNTLDLVIDNESGIWHLSQPIALSWAELGRRAAREAGLDESLIVDRPAAQMGWVATRPLYCALTSERGILMRPFEQALTDFLSHYRARRGARADRSLV